jgi:hypothetical protein
MAFILSATAENHKKSVKIVGVPANNQTKHLSNMSSEFRTLPVRQVVHHKITYTHPVVEEQILESNWSDQSPDLLSDLDANEKRLPPS